MAGWPHRAASLIFVIAKPGHSCQNQVTSRQARGGVRKRALVAPPLVQRGVINVISLKLQCSMSPETPAAAGTANMSSSAQTTEGGRPNELQTSLSRNSLFDSRPHSRNCATDDLHSVFQILAAL